MKGIHLKRTAVVAGLVGAAMGAALLVPAAAQANVTNPVGTQPGNLTLTPSSGSTQSVTPTWKTSTPCPAPNNQAANVVLIENSGLADVASGVVTGAVVSNATGFGGTMFAISDLAALVSAGQTYELAVDCGPSSGIHGVYVQSTFLTLNTDGSWSTSATGPAQPTPTTATLTAPSSVAINTNLTVTATVAPAAAAGTVQFFDGGVATGSPQAVSGGVATFSTTFPTAGSHTFTGQFTPTDTATYAKSPVSNPVSVVVTSGNVQAETINVNVPASQGPFIMTVSTTPVSLGTATLSSDFTKFTASGTLSDVTVSDERNQTVPGWAITGQMGNFSDGTHTIPGSALGWTPAVKTQNTAGDVVAGSPVAAAAPGLATASTLASAGAGKGLHTSVLTAGLSFQVPANTTPGAYSGLLTITAMP